MSWKVVRRWVFRSLVVGLLLLSALGLLLSPDYEVSRSIDIRADRARVLTYIADLKEWQHWTPWLEDDPGLKIHIADISSGPGAEQRWEGTDGYGRLVFTASDGDGLDYDLFFGDDPNPSKCSFRLTEANGSTQVSWNMRGRISTPVIGTYLARLMPGLISALFERGLANLKRRAEEKPNA